MKPYREIPTNDVSKVYGARAGGAVARLHDGPELRPPGGPGGGGLADDLMPKGTVLAQPTDQLASEIGWKTFFTDQHLQRLIQLALDNNRDLRVSALNIERARGLYQIQRADLMPGVSASGESSNKGVSADLSTTGEQTVSRQHALSVGVTSYELDFFGRIQSLKDKALETYLGTEEAYRSARLSLVSEVAQAYLALVADRERLNIATETLKSQQASYEMIARRHSVGVSSELDLRQAQTSVDTARVDIARYSGQVAKDITALSLLAGTKVTPDMLPAKALSELPVWPDIPGEPALHGAPPAPGHPSGRAYAQGRQRGHRRGAGEFLPPHFVDREYRHGLERAVPSL